MKKLLFVLPFLLSGCSVQPKYEKPAAELPETWKETAAPHSYPGAEDGRWWRIYEDVELDKTIDEALVGNADLLVAAARVDEARALLDESRSFFYPRIDAVASATRQRNSERTAFSPPGMPIEFSTYRAALAVSYEVDLFGRLRSNADAARAELEASEASRDAVRLALAAQVARSYFSLRSLDEQVALTRRTILLREDALGLQRRRLQGGVISVDRQRKPRPR
jgi:multidrug efflux system outer membrane protein